MNRKGFVYNVGLIFVVLTVMISVFIILSNKKNQFGGTIGETQFELIQHYQQIENILFEKDRLVKYRFSEAIKLLANNGGFLGKSECGKKDDLNLWTAPGIAKSKHKECYPFKEIPNLKKPLAQLIKTSLPTLFEGKLPQIMMKEKSLELKHIATEKSVSNILSPKSDNQMKVLGEYAVYPSFRISFPYSFEEYDITKQLVEKIIEQCAAEEEPFKCVFEQEVKKKKLLGKDCKEAEANSSIERYYLVCLKSEYMTFQDSPDIRFAFYLPDKTKPKLDVKDLFSNGAMDVVNVLSKLSGNELHMMAMVKYKEDPIFDTFEKIREGDAFVIPNYDKNKDYMYAMKVITENGDEYVYNLVIQEETTIINDGSHTGLSFEQMQ